MHSHFISIFLVEDFETESEVGDDRVSLRSFQSQVSNHISDLSLS